MPYIGKFDLMVIIGETSPVQKTLYYPSNDELISDLFDHREESH